MNGFDQLVDALRTEGLTEENAANAANSPRMIQTLLRVINRPKSTSTSLRNVYSDDHSPVIIDGTIYEWEAFLDLRFGELAPFGSKPFDARVFSLLNRGGVRSVRGLLTRSEAALLDIRNFGTGCLDALKLRLAEIGVCLVDATVNTSSFIKVGYEWRVQPSVLLKLQCQELNWPSQLHKELPTLQDVVNAKLSEVSKLLGGESDYSKEKKLLIIKQLRKATQA